MTKLPFSITVRNCSIVLTYGPYQYFRGGRRASSNAVPYVPSPVGPVPRILSAIGRECDVGPFLHGRCYRPCSLSAGKPRPGRAPTLICSAAPFQGPCPLSRFLKRLPKGYSMESTNDGSSQKQANVEDIELAAEIGLVDDDDDSDDDDDHDDDDDDEEEEEEEEAASLIRGSAAIELADPSTDLEVSSLAGNPDEVGGTRSEPSIGMVFQSAVAAYRLYNEYAKHMGFGVRKKLCRRSKTNNEMIAAWYVCTKEGKSAANEKAECSQSARRTGCRAALKVKRMANKEWKVVHFAKEHNHELDLENVCLFRSHMKNRISNRSRINMAGVGHKYAMAAPGKQSGGQDGECQNHMDRGQRRFFAPADAHAIHMLFIHMHSKNPAFFYAVEFDGEQHLKNVLWADAKAKVAYTHFGDVVTFDTTYLTDGYKVPFAPFVGVNHHGQSILLGCALVADQSTASFVWLFKRWLDAMSGRPPKAIISDYNKDIAAAISQVFPETRHRYCLWQILKRVPEKLGDVCEARENFLKKLNKCIYDSTTADEFERRWWKLIHRFGLVNEEWLQSLYKDRQQWVPLYLKDTFFAGMSISQRNESVSTIFHKFITRETGLKELLDKYEVALESKFEDEAQEDFWSFHSKTKERAHPSPFELQLADVYTRNMFEKFQIEVLGISSVFASKSEENGDIATYVVKAYEVQEKRKTRRLLEKEYKVVWNTMERKVCCACRLFEFKGYLCRHALAVFLALGVLEVPSFYILKRWTKDAKSRHVLDEGYTVHGDCSESVAQRFNDICVRSFKFAEEASVTKRSYDVALLSLREAFRRVTHANNSVRKSCQRNYPHNGA
ncbi:protein FAR1-RELATED SEQUENCE 4-like [Phoenix dactylifera]|uniref:Protein FAR1-RELATED SEQUENCE n=1 Tax=Phoenix dactylifera TaxID=42345 RepID=A0A8B9AV36_PHODC|nr:protein FAR1-RELATED SEQUENCE 4-like [Phoenix dactylifera]